MIANKTLKNIWEEFVYGGHLLSLGASGIIYTIMLIFNLKPSLPLLAMMYLMPQIIYSFDHLKGAEKDAKTNPTRSKYFQTQKKKIITLIVVYMVALLGALVYLKNIKIFLAVLFIIAMGMLYAKFFKNLTKKIPAFKNVFVAFMWAFTPIILVSLYYNVFNAGMLPLFIVVFLRLVVNTIFFDIKDIYSDKNNHIKTLPVVFGKNKAINFLQIINILSLAPIAIGVWLNILPSFSLGLLAFYFYSFYYLERAKNNKTDIGFLSYVLADGEYILWPITILLIKH